MLKSRLRRGHNIPGGKGYLMNILVINGSPKGKNSNTLKLTNAVLDGIHENISAKVEILMVKDMNIKPCLGCMSCWGKTAGKCVINDIMTEVYEKIMEADIIIESFPLFFFGMPGEMKTFTDRCLPLMETYRGDVKDIGDSAFHEPRFDMSQKKLVLISTCGYGRTGEIYDALIKEYNFICGAGKYTALLCPQGEMFSIPALKPQVDVYLKRYKDIGVLLGRGDDVPEDMIAKAAEPVLPNKAFKILVNNYWDSCK